MLLTLWIGPQGGELQQPPLPQAREAFAGHGQVIVQFDPHQLPRTGRRAGELDVLGREGSRHPLGWLLVVLRLPTLATTPFRH